MAKFEPPVKFDFTNPSHWPEWKQRFLRFRQATKLDRDDHEVQVSSLVYTMGADAEHIYMTFPAPTAAHPMTFDGVIAYFDAHFVPKRNTIYERARFRSRVQLPGESVECFIRALYDIAEHCDFGDGRDEMIRDSIVIGVRDKSVSQQL